MENEKQLTEHESLEIIQNMISAAKNDFKADAFIFLLWGWLVFIASISQYILAYMRSPYQGWPWMLMPVGGIVTAVYSMRKRKKEKAKTHVEDFLKYLWIAFTAGLLVILFFNKMEYVQILPVIITLYGIGLFVSGGALKFKPLIIGGIFCWACAIAGFMIQNAELLLIVALAVLGGYIIPGYMLKRYNRK